MIATRDLYRQLGLAKGLLFSLLLVGVLVPGCAPRGTRKFPRVLLIGIDGADPEIIHRLIAEGRLPTFARLEREGASGRLRSQEPLLSPIVWTTIATGRPPQEHRVLDFVEAASDGTLVPITSARRRVPALWNVAGQFGKTSGFVGWYASFPSEKVRGFAVSDRIAFHQVRSARATAGSTYPEGLAEPLRARFGEPLPDLAATRRRFLSRPEAPLSADGERRVKELAKIYATSEYYRKILPDLASQHRPDLLAVYFEAIDACGHLFMEDAPPKRPSVTEQDYIAFSATVDRCYEYQDEVLAELLQLAGPETVTLVVSDHGFKSGARRPVTSGRADVGKAPLWHRLYGSIFLHGGSVRAGTRLTAASIYDIAPTVLALLEVPMSRELRGRPLSQAFAQGTFSERPTIERYAPAEPPRTAASSADAGGREAVEKLVALGYISGGGAAPRHDAEGRTAASHFNEGMVLAQAGDFDKALRAYGKAVELNPKNTQALVTAAAAYIQVGDFARARELLDRAGRIEPDSFWLLVQNANWYLRSGRTAEADAALARAEKIDANLPSLHLMRARLQYAAGDPAAALQALDRAERLGDFDDMMAEILVLRAEVASSVADFNGAKSALDRALSYTAPERLASARGDLAFAQRDGKQAERFYRMALEAKPDSSSLERKLGETLGAMRSYPEADEAFRRAIAKAKTGEERESAYGDLSLLYQRQDREAEASATLREGVARVPGSHSLWGMLGAAYGRAGELDRAIEAYERSVSIQPTALGCKTLAALLFERRRDRIRAVALWHDSLRLDPNQPDVRQFLRRYGS